MPLMRPDVEGVQVHDLPRVGGVEAEPERALEGLFGDLTDVDGGQRCQHGHALLGSAQSVPTQHLGNPDAVRATASATFADVGGAFDHAHARVVQNLLEGHGVAPCL